MFGRRPALSNTHSYTPTSNHDRHGVPYALVIPVMRGGAGGRVVCVEGPAYQSKEEGRGGGGLGRGGEAIVMLCVWMTNKRHSRCSNCKAYTSIQRDKGGKRDKTATPSKRIHALDSSLYFTIRALMDVCWLPSKKCLHSQPNTTILHKVSTLTQIHMFNTIHLHSPRKRTLHIAKTIPLSVQTPFLKIKPHSHFTSSAI